VTRERVCTGEGVRMGDGERTSSVLNSGDGMFMDNILVSSTWSLRGKLT